MELKDQLILEDDLIIKGVNRFETSVSSADKGGRSSTTGYGRRLLKSLVDPLAEGIKDFFKPGPKKFGKWKAYIKEMNEYTLAYIALKAVLDNLHAECTATRLCHTLGSLVEDELRFSKFAEVNPKYYEAVMADLNRKNTRAYRHMRNVLAVTSKKKGFSWNTWPKDVKMGVGSVLLEMVRLHTNIIDVRKKGVGNVKQRALLIVVPTDEAVKWIEGYNSYASVLHPYTKPCVAPPEDWTGLHNGGYWSEAMRSRTPLIKGLNKRQEEFVLQQDLTHVFEAVNHIQRTAWCINRDVLKVMKNIWSSDDPVGLPRREPIVVPKFKTDIEPERMEPELYEEFIEWKAQASQLYTEENKRASKAFGASRIISMAVEYSKYDSIWFVYQCDFRGRVYASTSGLSPQGTDYNKALLQFKEGKPLGESGLYWLSVHGANCYGVDKVSFDERNQWVKDNEKAIIESGKNPEDHTSFWGEADKPYMFLAFCIEYSKAHSNPEEFVSHLPIGMDGSCNGLQNFSALLRDEEGGKATNLLPSAKPSDIYQQVADRAEQLIKEDTNSDDKLAWMGWCSKHKGLSRKLTKRSVMTLPYGATKFACFGFTVDAINEVDPDYFEDVNKVAGYLNDKIWESIGDVVISARHAMDWLQEVARVTASKDLPVWWINPAGFPVYQEELVHKAVQVRSCLLGGVRLKLQEEQPTISSRKQAQAVAPNFVHSLDSAHLMLTVNEAYRQGIVNFAMIHDDFGTHAADTAKLREIIKKSFVDMYTDTDPIQDLYTAMLMITEEEVQFPEPPNKGKLVLKDVLKSEYFFA